jgi:lipoprotein-releasing system permease protein
MNWVVFLVKKYLSLTSKKGMRFIVRLTVFGVVLGVATLTLTQAVLSGFQQQFRKSILGFNAHLVVLKEGEMEDFSEESKKIQGVLHGEVTAFTPFFYRESLLIHDGKVKGGVLKGIDPLTFGQVYDVEVRSLQTGQGVENVGDLFNGLTPYPSLILGENLAKELGVTKEKSLVKVFVPNKKKKSFLGDQEPKTGFKSNTTAGNFQWFQVVGLFSTGLYEFDRNFAFSEIPSLQKVFGAEQKITGMEMTLLDPQKAEELAGLLKQKLGILYQAVSWQKLNAPLFQALEIERVMFFVIMAMVVGVASFNVIGIVLLMIFEKTGEISILRALGASYRAIKRIFGYQGFLLGGVGVLLGLALGWLLGMVLKFFPLLKLEKEVYLVERLPVQFSFSLALSIVGVAMVIIYISTRIAVSRVEKAPLDL